MIGLVEIRHAGPAGRIHDRLTYTLDPSDDVTGISTERFAAQFARLDGLVDSNGTWSGMFAGLNEVTPDDATVLVSPAGPMTNNDYDGKGLAYAVAGSTLEVYHADRHSPMTPAATPIPTCGRRIVRGRRPVEP